MNQKLSIQGSREFVAFEGLHDFMKLQELDKNLTKQQNIRQMIDDVLAVSGTRTSLSINLLEEEYREAIQRTHDCIDKLTKKEGNVSKKEGNVQSSVPSTLSKRIFNQMTGDSEERLKRKMRRIQWSSYCAPQQLDCECCCTDIEESDSETDEKTNSEERLTFTRQVDNLRRKKSIMKGKVYEKTIQNKADCMVSKDESNVQSRVRVDLASCVSARVALTKHMFEPMTVNATTSE